MRTVQSIKVAFGITIMLIMCSFIIFPEGPPAYASEGGNVLTHKVKDIDGNEIDLSTYGGKVLMIVNVASKCGLTSQYEDLVAIHNKYRDRGFEILAFPANNFMMFPVFNLSFCSVFY